MRKTDKEISDRLIWLETANPSEIKRICRHDLATVELTQPQYEMCVKAVTAALQRANKPADKATVADMLEYTPKTTTFRPKMELTAKRVAVKLWYNGETFLAETNEGYWSADRVIIKHDIPANCRDALRYIESQYDVATEYYNPELHGYDEHLRDRLRDHRLPILYYESKRPTVYLNMTNLKKKYPALGAAEFEAFVAYVLGCNWWETKWGDTEYLIPPYSPIKTPAKLIEFLADEL